MMDNLRSAANHVVLKIILGLIIVSFVLTGVGNYLIGGNNNYAAKVNGQEISRAQFENEVMNERNRQQQQYGDRFSELAGNDGYMKNMRQQVLQRVIDETLLNQYAKELGLNISDSQIKEAIFSNPAFQRDGHFDNQLYNAIISNMRITPDQYAQALRKQLITQQLVRAIVGSDFLLPGEAQSLAALVSQQRIVREATLSVDALAHKQQVSEDEIKAYYEQNKSRFMVPEQYRVSYIKLDAATINEDVSDAEIQAWYDQNRARFTQPARYRYSVIQTKTDADAKAAIELLKKGEDFASVAKAKSTDIISARKGGDMGWLEASTLPDELKNAGLKEKGQLSGVIASSVGFLVARLDDVQPEQVKSLAVVRNDIANKVKQEKALDAFYALQQKVSDAASNDNESLASAEQAAGVKAVETDWFSRDNLPEALNFKPVADAIFNGSLVGENNTPGSNSDIINVDGDRAFVLRVSDHKPAAEKPLEQVRNDVLTALQRHKAEQQAKDDAAKLLAALKKGDGDKALRDAGLSFGQAKTLDRTGQDPISLAVFNLPLPEKDRPGYGVASDMQGNVVLLALDEVRNGDMPADQKKVMEQGLTQNNAQITFEALMDNLRKSAKIKLGDFATQQ
ncbi:peptidylprolyl isomerase [Enterobacteriaceae bacterium YMB-R22]|jgi:peptidyl-prolyl cis-trans isomerase D|uniref:peptidylprolyl isomerase n=1 Tax=Tenebrionicola larvae TaxID=2815733 RepID=UPI002011EAE9|nr:peptidylprolyl isomerase [Tenebrionicola larvae]MBV4413794.1 peptidylprolyl isomerase [Tenebrionicola larvae]